MSLEVLLKYLTYIKSIICLECCHFYSNIVCFDEKMLLNFSYVDTFYTFAMDLSVKSMGSDLLMSIKSQPLTIIRKVLRLIEIHIFCLTGCS
jgi:hypothetical protein